MGKRALALGGGGARGAYEIGVWRALREMGEDRFDIITGTSVGALNGAAIAQGDYEKAVRFWDDVSTEKILRFDTKEGTELSESTLAVMKTFTREAIRNRGADTSPLREMLSACIEEEKVRASGVDFGLVTVSLPAGKPHCLFLSEVPQGRLLDFLMASSAFFPAMQAQVIDGTAYVDGGYYDNVPAAMAAARGAVDILAVDLKAPGLHRAVSGKNVRVKTITSAWDLGPVLVFRHEYVQRNVTLGYLDTLRAFGRCEGVLYAFQNGTAESYEAVYQSRISTLYEALLPETARRFGGKVEPLKGRVLRMFRGIPWKGSVPLAVGWMENAGRVFGISPLRIYTVSEFCTAVKEAGRKQGAVSFSEVERSAGVRFSRPHQEVQGKEALNAPSRREIAMAFFSQIALSLHDEAERRRLWAAALLFPSEAAAGAFLACGYESL